MKLHINRLLMKHGMDQARTFKSSMDLMYLKSIHEIEVFGDMTKYRPVWSEAYSTSPCRIDLISLPVVQQSQEGSSRLETPVLLRNACCAP